MKNIIAIALTTLILASCEKIVDINYKSNQSQVVISGNVTNQNGPYFVRITKSVSLKDAVAYPVINNATVVISDDTGYRETLTSLGNGIYTTHTLQGAEGRTYTLSVEAENQTYTAISTMPKRVPFDSIKLETAVVTGEMEYSIIPAYIDPTDRGNCYRFVLRVNNKLVNQHLVQNDEVRNGVANTVRLEINDNDLKFKTGDTVAVEMQCIDEKVSKYYTTLALMGDSGPGGGATPNNPPGNISNGALGLFSAYTVAYRDKVLP